MDLRATNLPQVLRLLVGLVALSAIGGLIMAGIAIPAVGAGGAAAKNGVKAFNDLPSQFRIRPLAQQSKILDAKGGLIANPYDENRIIVSLDKISPWMRKAQVAIEDSRFYHHGGLDLRGFMRAFVSNLGGGGTQGASTLTQQYVKITLQENALRRDDKAAARAATAKSYTRKLQELKYALDVERNYTKDQILTGYLNLVYYGDQAYGVEAAARNYFGIPASKLDLAQAATLAGIVQAPTAYNPVAHPQAAQHRRNQVLDRMFATGAATAKQVAAAKREKVTASLNRKPAKGVCQRSKDPYVCAYLMEYLQFSPQMSVLGRTPAERLKNVNQGGLTIHTSIDPDLQRVAMQEMLKAVDLGAPKNIAAATSIVEPGTGKIKALAQTTSFGTFQSNLNVDRHYGGGIGYQFGSTAKPYALVAALESGMSLNSTIDAPVAAPGDPHQFPRSETRGECGSGEPTWPVANDVKMGGVMSLTEATAKSVNTAFARLVIQVGPCRVHDVMDRMYLYTGDGREIDKTSSSITLGAGITTPLTIAASYAAFAARGKYCVPTPIAKIVNADGKEVDVPATRCEQVIRPEVAEGVNKLLRGPLGPGGTASSTNWNQGRHAAAGKTGTTNNHNQSWFVGYTPQLSTAVWLGNVKPADANRNLYTLNRKYYKETYGYQRQVFGGTIAAPMWAKIMRYALQDMPDAQFEPPQSDTMDSGLIDVPDIKGKSVPDATKALKDAGFLPYIAGKVSSFENEGIADHAGPKYTALPQTSVGIWVSNGKKPY